jgi:nucleoside-diphosphate-sugar epimerase
MKSLRTLVTGGAGFIGSHLVDRLMKEDYEVMVLDNFSTGKVENIQLHLGSQKFHLVKGDVRNLENVREAVRDVDVVFHLAAIVNVPLSIEDPLLVNDVNVRGTLNLLKASLKENIERFIYVSSCAVYGEAHYLPINEEHSIMPLSPYGVSKFAAEHYCKIFHRIHGLKTVCLRFFNVYGPRQSVGPYSGVITQFIGRLKRGKLPIIYGDGEQTRDFVYVKDVVEASMLVLKCQRCAGEVISVGTGKPTTINELAKVLMNMFRETNAEPEYAPPKPGDIQHSHADIKKAERMLGYKPSVVLKEGIRKLLHEQTE